MNIEMCKDYSIPEYLLDMKLTDILCKHTLLQNSDKAITVTEESKKIGYKWCKFGSNTGHDADFDWNLRHIKNMEKDNYEHTLRIVRCKYSFFEEVITWCDNMHSAIMQIRNKGLEVTLKEVPFYIVDITDLDNAIVIPYNNSVKSKRSDILGAVSCAYYRYESSNSKKLIETKYTIGEFLSDNYQLCQQEHFIES